MRLFQTRRPRQFNHKMIYADNRSERVKDIERRARQELGMTVIDGEGTKSYSFSGDKRNNEPKLRRGLSNAQMVVLAVALLLLLWFYFA